MRSEAFLGTLPRQRSVVQFTYPDRPENKRSYWLVVEANGTIDVADDHVRLEVTLPWLLAGIAHGAQAMIRVVLKGLAGRPVRTALTTLAIDIF